MIEVCNNIRLKKYGTNSTRTGLGNPAERYALLMGKEIRITNHGKIFSVGFNII